MEWFVFAILCFVIVIALKDESEDNVKTLKDLTKRAEILSDEFEKINNQLDNLEKTMEEFNKKWHITH